MKDSIAIFWFRRDLRLEDNTALNAALLQHEKVLPIFIFDTNILDELDENDPRVSFIHSTLESMDKELLEVGSGISCFNGKVETVFKHLIEKYNVTDVFFNKDYEPYALSRDKSLQNMLYAQGISLHTFKDQVIFEELEITKDDKTPYTVFTPYKKKWLHHFNSSSCSPNSVFNPKNFYQSNTRFPSLSSIGFKPSLIKIPSFSLAVVDDYKKLRDFPSIRGTSQLSTHLRFGTVSIRNIIQKLNMDSVFLSELIWREFFMQILYNFPRVVSSNFKEKYNQVQWRNNTSEFNAWIEGKTGYPIVDAGMRELNKTGLMHNRVRMITAGFLCKHLLIDWRWGEAYFASKLLDYDLSANNGNWQWAAGTGCDSAPYFRIFNPSAQQKKFDKEAIYTNKWNPGWELSSIAPIVDHAYARKRALETYKIGLAKIV
ncbi:MAG: deoxyribodipyrimidine photo-lyase [Flavobacteriales bacterium]|nr:deoxyribodipyrimidine photo-lyase [Flavobacteriales bacterium]